MRPLLTLSLLILVVASTCANPLLMANSAASPVIDYLSKGRPQLHFSVPYGWMNDPNGFVEKDGKFTRFSFSLIVFLSIAFFQPSCHLRWHLLCSHFSFPFTRSYLGFTTILSCQTSRFSFLPHFLVNTSIKITLAFVQCPLLSLSSSISSIYLVFHFVSATLSVYHFINLFAISPCQLRFLSFVLSIQSERHQVGSNALGTRCFQRFDSLGKLSNCHATIRIGYNLLRIGYR